MLASGDLLLLTDRKGRRYLVTLAAGDTFHFHQGTVAHDDLIGRPEGSTATSSLGGRGTAVRPSLADYVLKMPRGAQVVYPKDVASILVEADIFPGATVLEAGTGSASLTLALLRAVGPKGTVNTFEIREDFQTRALANIERFAGGDPNLGRLEARLDDVYTTDEELDVDRVVLDLAEPWRALATIDRVLRPGGILCSYMPTITQVQQLMPALRDGWTNVTTFETMRRTWTVDGPSVRPDHRMVAHTAFLVTARKLADDD